MGMFILICLSVMTLLPWGFKVWAAVFVVAWIGQFIGHKIEGKKPSFFEDLQFLLIGCLNLMNNNCQNIFKESVLKLQHKKFQIRIHLAYHKDYGNLFWNLQV